MMMRKWQRGDEMMREADVDATGEFDYRDLVTAMMRDEENQEAAAAAEASGPAARRA